MLRLLVSGSQGPLGAAALRWWNCSVCTYIRCCVCVCVCVPLPCTQGEVCIQDGTCRGWVLSRDGTVLEAPSALLSSVLVSRVSLSLTNVWLV